MEGGIVAIMRIVDRSGCLSLCLMLQKLTLSSLPLLLADATNVVQGVFSLQITTVDSSEVSLFTVELPTVLSCRLCAFGMQ
jgi:hypothetical protein